MKLITKTILYYLLVCIPLLIVVAAIALFLIKRAVNENLNEQMWDEAQRAKSLINSFKTPKNMVVGLDSLSTINIDTTGGKGYRYLNIFKIDPEDGEHIEYKMLRYYHASMGTNYLITITKPKLEEDDLIENLVDTLLITICLLVLAFFILNWILSRTLWKPFRETVSQLKNYEIKNHNSLILRPTSTKEFKELNEAVQKMTEKIRSDFEIQKEFTENASHETQTPLAVIKARLDLLLQSPNLKENDMKQLEVIEQAVTKLSSLNKALLLLAKIENNQFREMQEVDLGTVINKTLSLYEDMIRSRSIAVDKQIKEPIILKADPILIDILVSNLIQNAVRHNGENGSITIELQHRKLTISNSGKPLAINKEKMFERFRKNDGSKESLGLGLAIVKSIINAYAYKCNYEYVNGLHTFIIEF